jgi:nitrate reductase gamma subunit
VALGLIGGIVVVGFILEGMRIAMVEGPADAVYAIVGFGISRLFWGVTGLTDAYGYLWYVHAILTAVFVAYLPFSRLMHIIMAPVVLVMNAVLESE